MAVTLQEALFNEMAHVPLYPALLKYGTYDLEDETGPHTGWFCSGYPLVPMAFLEGASDQSEATGAADTYFLSRNAKRATEWNTAVSSPTGNCTCYII